jgi:hypothetical protein
MKAPLFGIICILASAPPASPASSPYRIGDVRVIRQGKLEQESTEEISKYFDLRDSKDRALPVNLDKVLNAGDVMKVLPGANVGVLAGRSTRTWVDYGGTFRVRDDKTFELTGHTLHKEDGNGNSTFAGPLSTATGDGTEYYFSVDPDLGSEKVYVFEGSVIFRHVNGTEVRVGKGQAAEATKDGLKFIEMFEPDLARVKKWRENVRWAQLSWLAKVIRFPVRNPVVSGLILGVGATYVVSEVLVRDDSELVIEVVVP